MKKHLVTIEKITQETICLEADNPSDLLNWSDLDSYRKLPYHTLDKLQQLDQAQKGFWRIQKIQPEDEIIENSRKPPDLPNIPKNRVNTNEANQTYYRTILFDLRGLRKF